MTSEFDLIRRFFTRPTPSATLGVGDDAALLRPTPGMELAVSTDLLVEGTHFLAGTDARDLGWKTLAVNVSDLAAMGAQPRWATLGLALPDADPHWLGAFAAGFFECANTFGVELIGGDTTRGPRTFAVTIIGEVAPGQALRRSGAQPGDDIWISGRPGRAALGLAHLQLKTTLHEPALSECLAALNRPQPRVALGLALPGVASAAIDVSDGLLADLGHVLAASHCSAQLTFAVPPAPTFTTETYLTGGDDYELLFTAPKTVRDRVERLGSEMKLDLSRLGSIVSEQVGKLVIVDADGNPMVLGKRGYDHFG